MKVELGQIVTSRSMKRPELRVVCINTQAQQVLVECSHKVRSAVRENTAWYHNYMIRNPEWHILRGFNWDDTKYYYNFEMSSLRRYGKQKRVFTKTMISRELVRLYRVAV